MPVMFWQNQLKKMIYCLFKLDIYLFDYVYAP